MEVTSQGSPLLQGTVSRNAVTLGQDGWVYAGKTAYVRFPPDRGGLAATRRPGRASRWSARN